jgi:predicted PurR-regulated permease PerM
VVSLQASNYFNMQSWHYVILVLGLCFLLDQIFDNLISPRVIGQTLGLHPAAVLIAAIIAANLLGIIGLVLAAPVLATVLLLGRYASRKMLDLDPWPPEPEPAPRQPQAMERLFRRIWRRLQAGWRLFRQKT